MSALLLLMPTTTAAFLLKPGISFDTLMLTAALAGVGGGNFASSMTNINSFYPQRLKGAALGLNAGGGNIGVATVQLVGLLVLATAGKAHPRLLLGVYIPLIVIAALCASLFMDNIAHVRNEKRALRQASGVSHTWIISFLYIGTFGSFIGFGFAFGQVLQNQFGAHFLTAGKIDPVKIAYLTFLGPLIGSVIRPVGGWLADRFGGARTTFLNFVAMAAAAGVVLAASKEKSLGLFFVGFMALFVFSGIGNGSTYKMIPAIFRAKGARPDRRRFGPGAVEHESRRYANAVIGIAGAIGAFGGVLVNIAFRQSFLHTKNGDAAYIGFIAFYLVCVAVTWAVYVRAGKNRLAGWSRERSVAGTTPSAGSANPLAETARGLLVRGHAQAVSSRERRCAFGGTRDESHDTPLGPSASAAHAVTWARHASASGVSSASRRGRCRAGPLGLVREPVAALDDGEHTGGRRGRYAAGRPRPRRRARRSPRPASGRAGRRG